MLALLSYNLDSSQRFCPYSFSRYSPTINNKIPVSRYWNQGL